MHISKNQNHSAINVYSSCNSAFRPALKDIKKFLVIKYYSFVGAVCNFGGVLLLQIYAWIFATKVIPQFT